MVWIHFKAQDYVYRRKLIWRTNFCYTCANLSLTDRVCVGCIFSFEQKFASCAKPNTS
jgi:ribosomal protein L32